MRFPVPVARLGGSHCPFGVAGRPCSPLAVAAPERRIGLAFALFWPRPNAAQPESAKVKLGVRLPIRAWTIVVGSASFIGVKPTLERERDTIARLLLEAGCGVTLTALVLSLGSCSTPSGSTNNAGLAKSRREFTTTVKPLLESRCAWCHSNDEAQGGLNFQDRNGTLDSPRRFIVPGSPEHSLVYLSISRPDAHPRVMPGDGWGISETEKRSVEAWISNGAHWPGGRAGAIKRKAYRVDKDDYM